MRDCSFDKATGLAPDSSFMDHVCEQGCYKGTIDLFKSQRVSIGPGIVFLERQAKSTFDLTSFDYEARTEILSGYCLVEKDNTTLGVLHYVPY